MYIKNGKMYLFSFLYLNTSWQQSPAETLTMYHMPSLPLIEEKSPSTLKVTAHAHSQPQEAS